MVDDTIFIFCSDNGTAITAKSRGVERGCHVPFIVCGAGVKKRGATGEICDLSDILPTLVDFAGSGIPARRDFVAELAKACESLGLGLFL